MLSIYNAFLTSNQQETELNMNMLRMVCEIVNNYRDTYVNLHCCLTLAIFCKFEHQPEVTLVLKTLFLKLTSANVGLDDSAATYLGHAIVNLISKNTDESDS